MVRQALANEILALQQTQTIDSDGVYIRLSAMIKSLNGLNAQAFLSQQTQHQENANPLLATEQTETSFSWQSMWKEIWGDLQKAIVIRRLDQTIQPLLAPEQSYYLKQNLRLMLEQASLSLLDKNQVTFQDSLEKASLWLNNYFDLTVPNSKILLTSINEMQQVNIAPVLPDISNSLRLLKGKIETMYQNHALGKLSRPAEQVEEGAK